MTDATTRTHSGLPKSAASLVPVLFGHAAFQHLNAACQLGLLELLHECPGVTAAQIAERLALQPRAARILLLGTTSLNLSILLGDRYQNSSAIEDLFADGVWEIFRDLVEFEASIVYLSHSDYVESLKKNTNAGLHWFPGTEPDLYRRLEHSPRLLELFYRCMNSWSRVANAILTQSGWFDGCQHVLDVGGGDGVNALALVGAFADLRVTILDLEGAISIARQKVERSGLGFRIQVAAGDMFTMAYPDGCDCVLLANQVAIWSPTDNLRLVTRAYDALPAIVLCLPGGSALFFRLVTDARNTVERNRETLLTTRAARRGGTVCSHCGAAV
jgi:hypothetical protein